MKAAPRFKTQIEEKQDKEEKEAIEESKRPQNRMTFEEDEQEEALQQPEQTFVQPDPMQFVPVDVESWKTVVDYPIIAFANKEKPQEVLFGHLTNGIQELVTHQIN